MWDSLEYYQKLITEIDGFLSNKEIEILSPSLESSFLLLKHKLEKLGLTNEQIRHFMNNEVTVNE